MFKVFIRGLVFGAGFSIALFAVGFALTSLLNYTSETKVFSSAESDIRWHTLSEEEKIKAASAIAIIRYTEGQENQKIATIDSIHTKTPDIEMPYKVGSPWPSANYYPKYEFDDRTGAVVLFKGSPATDLSTWYVYSERISALGDMPLELLIKKFKEGV